MLTTGQMLWVQAPNRRAMNLQTEIRPELWSAIADSYEKGQYSHAVIEAMHYLSQVLRDKTSFDGDGASLVGQALGGGAPRLRLTKLRTETERDVQRGYEQILRGLYIGIRNPRSHEQTQDTLGTASAIIVFINHLLDVLEQSQQPFVLENFLAVVFDQDFVEDDQYANLLAEEIPANRRLDVLIEIYRRKLAGNPRKNCYMVSAIVGLLSNDQVADFLEIVSDELQVAVDQKAVQFALRLLPPQLWPKLKERARLRIENKLIQDVAGGKIDRTGKVPIGALGTWGKVYARYFQENSRIRLARVLVEKLESPIAEDTHYIMKFFLSSLPSIVREPGLQYRAIKAISRIVRTEDEQVADWLVEFIDSEPAGEWRGKLIEELKDYTDPGDPRCLLADGTPFLRIVLPF
jgi:uncharacterized protein (TIGR02391 family)